MKKNILIALVALLFSANLSLGQDIPQNQVPSVIVNNFHKLSPKASDIEWKMDGDLYKVEFETGMISKDHEAWYNKSGGLVKHKEEITQSDLPKKVSTKINTDFKGYRADDIKKITEDNQTTYTLELKKLNEEWKVAFDSNGGLLSKVAD